MPLYERQTAAAVFSELNRQMEGTLAELDELRRGKTDDKSRVQVPDTELIIKLSSHTLAHHTHTTTIVSALRGETEVPLIGATHDSSCVAGQPVERPERIFAFRAQEELPDFEFSNREGGLVIAHLGELGITGRVRHAAQNPGVRPDTIIGAMETPTQDIFTDVDTAIRAQMGVVEWMGAGADFETAQSWANAGEALAA